MLSTKRKKPLQKVNDIVAEYLKLNMGVESAPAVSQNGIELGLSSQVTLQLWVHQDQLNVSLNLGETHNAVEDQLSSIIEDYDTPQCFFRVFTHQHCLWVATNLDIDDLDLMKLDQTVDRLHKLWLEMGSL